MDEVDNALTEKVFRQVFGGGQASYKGFLYHIERDNPLSKNILKLKEPRKKLKVLMII